MANNKRKAVTRKAPAATQDNLQAKPDLTPEDARKELIDQILAECIKLEEGRIQTVFPLCKLTAQFKELTIR